MNPHQNPNPNLNPHILQWNSQIPPTHDHPNPAAHAYPTHPHPEPQITVNGFRFCEKHGDERCYICRTDNLPANTSRIKPHLPHNLDYDLDGRPSINAYYVGAIQANMDKYRCNPHDYLDCHVCFDWSALIMKYIKRERPRGRRGA